MTIPAISQVVVLNADGVVLGAQQYDPAGRVDAAMKAAAELAAQISVMPPDRPLMSRDITASDGNIWMRLSSQGEIFQPGWVEIGLGKWGPNV